MQIEMLLSDEDKTLRSFATKDNLDKALARLGFDKDRHMVVCTPKGRWTAIFPVSNFSEGGYVGLYASEGFFTLG